MKKRTKDDGRWGETKADEEEEEEEEQEEEEEEQI